jgi:putative ABC transport system permease protein
MLEGLFHDLRYSWRALNKNRGFTAIAVLTMAVGIGANTTIFSTLDAVVFRPFSFPDQDRLVTIFEHNPEVNIIRGSVAPANFNDWRDQASSLDNIAALRTETFDLSKGDQPERFTGNLTSVSFFDVLNVKPAYGRTFTFEDGRPGKNQVVILKHSLWQSRFGADPNIIDQPITLNGQSFTVIGVMPADFNYPFNGGELWAPLVLSPKLQASRFDRFLNVIGRLAPGVDIDQARQELNSIAAHAAILYPESNAGRAVRITSITDDATRGARPYAPIMMASVAFVLLIACANVANLLLVRAASRQREVAIRLAIGASRFRLVRQLLTESVLVALLGGAVGLLLSVWGIEGIARGIPESFSRLIPGWQHLQMNKTTFLFTFGASIFTGILCGLIPALSSTRMNVNENLKEGNKGGPALGANNKARNFLVVSEVALSLVLLIGAGLMIRSFVQMLQSDFGVNPSDLLTMQLSVSGDRYSKPEQRSNFYREVIHRVSGLPGVSDVAAASTIPMGFINNGRMFTSIGEKVFPQSKRPYSAWRAVTPEYLAAVGTPLHKGRNFTDQDIAGGPRVAMVNEAFARRFLPDEEPIGQQFKIDERTSIEIVGVIANVMNEDMDDLQEPVVHVPYAQEPGAGVYLLVRGHSNPTELTRAIRNEVAALDKSLPLFDVKPMTSVIDDRVSPKRLATLLLGCFAVIALLLAGVGLYAVMSYSVAQRTHEIGIRTALGAQSRDVLRLILKQGMFLAGIGLVIGLATSFGVMGTLSSLLFGVSATDPLTFGSITFLLAGVTVLACYIPARRATRVDPLTALRNE